MARTKDEIFEGLIAAKDASPTLSAVLTSNSKASFYQSLFTVISEEVGEFELEFDLFVSKMDALLDEKQVMTIAWWYYISFAFQIGDAVLFDGAGQSYYDVIDEDLQIVKFSSPTDAGSADVILRVAGESGGLPVKIEGVELAAFTAYIEVIKPAGYNITIISEDGDEVTLVASAVIDPQVINVNDGTLISDPTQIPVEDAIIEYISNFQRNEFGNTFRVNNLLQYIINVNGVTDFIISSFEKKSSIDPSYIDVLALAGLKFNAFAGYVRIKDGYDLGANITYSIS